jgi:hypothetical protein
LSAEAVEVLGVEREAERVMRIAKEGVDRFTQEHGGEGFFQEEYTK